MFILCQESKVGSVTVHLPVSRRLCCECIEVEQFFKNGTEAKALVQVWMSLAAELWLCVGDKQVCHKCHFGYYCYIQN